MSHRSTVAILARYLPRYRIPFFERLRERLASNDVDLLVVYGQPDLRESSRGDAVDLQWGIKIRNRSLPLASRTLYWQPALALIRRADLVVVEQASKLLINYLLLCLQATGITKLAFWGHGRNFQDSRTGSRVGEAIKNIVSKRADWWFAYNELSAHAVRALGYPSERITLVQNTIDTRALIQGRSLLTPSDIEAVRSEHKIVGTNVCIYCGGMYAEKCLDFLIEACIRIRERVADFEMAFVGGGPDEAKLRRAATRHEWIHMVGPRFDEEKIPYFAMSKLFLMPGLVGLGLLDAFALQTPLVTTDVDFHSPEIAYLESERNGLILPHDVDAYVDGVVSLLTDERRRAELVEGCRRASNRYTIEEMASRFADGVFAALGHMQTNRTTG